MHARTHTHSRGSGEDLCHHVLDPPTPFSDWDSPQYMHDIPYHGHGNHMRREMFDSPDRMTNALYILDDYVNK